MPRRKDIWRCGIVRRPIDDILSDGDIGQAVSWFPEEPDFQFIADPFGYRDATALHVFVEHYDYRTRHGVIQKLTLDEKLQIADRRVCLAEPWHISYPQIFAGEGAIWMLPEGYRSGTLTLYRDHGGLADWRAECDIMLDCVPVDASILRHAEQWWLFYSPADSKAARKGHLHIAWADRLSGPWMIHPGNPVRVDRSSSRPGGTPVVVDGRIMLPVQDCASTYGAAVRPLWIERLDHAQFVAEAGKPVPIPRSAGAYRDGMHTLSACGDLTLIDVKRIDRSLRGLLLDVKRMLHEYDR